MMADAIKKAQRVDWKTGKLFSVSLRYVSDFVNAPKWRLKAFKASNIDPLRTKKASPNVRDAFFDLYEGMIEKLYKRGQDPNDHKIPSSFVWRHPSEIPPEFLYNMDEVGNDTNKSRARVVGSREQQCDGLRHVFEETDGDNNPFHVTACVTTCAKGTTKIPVVLGHSNPSSKAKDREPKMTNK